MTGDGVVEVSVYIAAQPETVFPYFTDPGRYIQWMGAGATLEPVPGGCYRILMRDGVETAGEFVEVDPPYRLVFTWGWTHDHAVPPGTTRVVVTLRAERGGTRVVLRHYGLPETSSAITTARGGSFTSTGWACAHGVAIPAQTRTPDRCRGPCIAPDNGHGLIATAPVQEGLPMPEGRRLSWAEVRVAVLTVACCPSSACG